jgi:hypothetical protein
MEASATGGAWGRSIDVRIAAVQFPSVGAGTTSTMKWARGARVIHSSTAEEWSFCKTRTREPAGLFNIFAAAATP